MVTRASSLSRLLLLLAALLVGTGCPTTSVDDDDATANDDDATANDDDATANDDDATANDDDATGDDDDATANDDDATGDDDDATGDDDDSGDDDDATPDPCLEDADSDGVTACGPDGLPGTADDDCDDNDAANHPGNTETCDGQDNDCDGVVDNGFDVDTDGVTSCGPDGVIANADDDCDDADPNNFPGNPEVCDGQDNDCDGVVDDGFDGDLDGQTACGSDGVLGTEDDDCDDVNLATYPGVEVCDGQDNDCDGVVDDGFDGDLDGVTECGPDGMPGTPDDDCDDNDDANFPGNPEICDGQDNDCDSTTSAPGGEADGDNDGTPACDDCDDTEPSVAAECRPDPGCVSPDATTLQANDPPGATDLAFSPGSCDAYVSGIISGADLAYVIDGTGGITAVTGYSNWNHTSIALDPSVPGDFYVAHNQNSSAGIGYSAQSATITNLYTSTYNAGSLWSNFYLNQNQSSIAMDSAGCLWAPNLTGSGTLDCIDAAGTVTTVLSALPSRPESVGLDAQEAVYISLGAELHLVDITLGATTLVYTAGADILDFVFDYNDDVYVETTAGSIELVPPTGVASVFQTVSGQGKLAIAPDGWLVRIVPAPTGAATYEEWPLGP